MAGVCDRIHFMPWCSSVAPRGQGCSSVAPRGQALEGSHLKARVAHLGCTATVTVQQTAAVLVLGSSVPQLQQPCCVAVVYNCCPSADQTSGKQLHLQVSGLHHHMCWAVCADGGGRPMRRINSNESFSSLSLAIKAMTRFGPSSYGNLQVNSPIPWPGPWGPPLVAHAKHCCLACAAPAPVPQSLDNSRHANNIQ